jgi:hypothetical protein
MTRNSFAGTVACAALLCAAGLAQAQGTSSGSSSSGSTAGSGSSGGSAMSSDNAASSSSKRGASSQKGTSSKSGTGTSGSGPTTSPAGGVVGNPKDITPGTYNQSGSTVPTTSDPAQTRSMRDGSPSPSATRASGAATSGTMK